MHEEITNIGDVYWGDKKQRVTENRQTHTHTQSRINTVGTSYIIVFSMTKLTLLP